MNEPSRVVALREQIDQIQERIDALGKLPASLPRDERMVMLTDQLTILKRQLRDARNRAHVPAVTPFGDVGWHDVTVSGR